MGRRKSPRHQKLCASLLKTNLESNCTTAHDLAFETAQMELRQFRYLTFENFALSLRIRDTTVWQSDLELENYPAERLFTIHQGLTEYQVRAKLEIRINCEPRLSVWYKRKWRSLPFLLQSLMANIPRTPFSYADLSNMWEQNGKYFPFLQLPRELRDLIYMEVLFHPRTWSTLPYQYAHTPGKGLTKARSPHNLNLLAKRWDESVLFRLPTHEHDHPRGFNTETKGRGGTLQVYEEASAVLYSRGKFSFDAPRQLNHFFRCIRDRHWQMVREIMIDFSFQELLDVLGANLGHGYNYLLQPAIEDLPTLKLWKLQIVIPSPSSLVHADIPLWGQERGGCHTKIVQLTLDLLRPHVAHLSSGQLQLEGFIKPAQKRRFMDALQHYQHEPEGCKLATGELLDDGEEGGAPLYGPHIEHYLHSPEWTEERDHGLAETMMYDPEDIFPDFELPSRCECKHRCTLESSDFQCHYEDDDFATEQDCVEK